MGDTPSFSSAGRSGFGASTRNGGQVGSGNQKFRVKKLIELRGRKKAEEMLREGTRMLDYIATLIETEKIDCHFRRSGRFRCAIRPEHYEAMAADMRDLKEIAGVESFMVPRVEQASEIGSDIFFGGSVLPNDASLHPGLYHAGLMQRVEHSGGSILDHTSVENIEAVSGGFRVLTGRGENIRPQRRCRDEWLYGWSRSRTWTSHRPRGIGHHRHRRAFRSALQSTAAEEPRLRQYQPRLYYFRGAPDARRIIWGGRVGRLAPSTSPAAFQHLARDMLQVFPDLKDVSVTHAWDGLIGYTYDEIPHIGCTASGVHYALGYCGTGVSRATYFGNKIALQVLRSPEGRTSFDDLAFPAFPAHPIARRAIPVVETWYRIRDALKI